MIFNKYNHKNNVNILIVLYRQLIIYVNMLIN